MAGARSSCPDRGATPGAYTRQVESGQRLPIRPDCIARGNNELVNTAD